MAKAKDIIIEQGRTFRLVVRWENEKIIYKPITAVTKAAPVVITATGHSIPDGWNVAVTSVLGMTQLNSANSPPKEKDYVPATKLTDDTIELNAVNAAAYSTYTSGGYVQYYEPHALSGVTARVKIKDKVGGTTLLTSEGLTPTMTAVVDDANKTITLTIDATETEAITWTKGVYDVEAVDGSVVYALLTGSVSVTKEITTTL